MDRMAAAAHRLAFLPANWAVASLVRMVLSATTPVAEVSRAPAFVDP